MKQATRKESAFERDYRKAWIKLLTQAAQIPRQIDEYFFGQADDRDEASEEIRPYFYGFILFSLTVLLFCYVVVSS